MFCKVCNSFTYKKIFILSVCCFLVTIIFGFVASRSILEFGIRDQVSLREGNFVRKMYLKYPIPLDFRVNFFNVTNPEQVHTGAAPVLKEIGPYCYDLYKERIDVEDDDTQDTLTYTPKDIYIFNQERTGSLKEDDYVTIIHPLIMGMVGFVVEKAPQFIALLDEALPYLFENQSIYFTGQVKDILFDGMKINCSAKEFGVIAICTHLKTQLTNVKIDEEGNLLVGLLDQKNGTMSTRIKIHRGIRNNEELGELVAVDNANRTKNWVSEECNKFRGTDGWIFPPLSNDKDEIWLHPPDLCMNLHADFVENTMSNGLAVQKYYSDFNNDCQNCTKRHCSRGVIDLTECLNVPVYISLPHFLKTDSKVLGQLEGLSPETESHSTRILLEGTLSIPIEAQIRFQFNFYVQNVSRISFMHTMPTVMHPMMWLEMGVVLNGWLLNMIKGFFYFLTFLEILKYALLVLSLIGMVYASYLYLNNKNLYNIKENNIVLK